ncbi:MAG: DUF4259 domain-containing protein [Streptosporangiaceae bacterium]
MGAFENDTAADWSWEFESADLAAGLQLITGALTLAARADGASSYLDGDDGSRAIAAAAMVAAINGHPIDESAFGEDARQWITRVHPSSDPSLTSLARQAVSRVTGPTSELSELWFPEHLPSWQSAMAELLGKLHA